MEENIKSFPNHLINSFSNFNSIKLTKNKFNSILIVGQGGSSVGALILSDLLKKDIKIPIIVNHGYKLPNWVSKETLIIISSYSGNTEETLNILKLCINKGFIPECVSSGGKILKICNKNKINFTYLPEGYQPREALGFSIYALFSILYKYGIISRTSFMKLKNSSKQLSKSQAEIIKKAKELSVKIYNKVPIIYSSNLFVGLVTRFKQQLNENSKNLCWFNIIPEMNHNEIVGWDLSNKDINSNFISIFIKSHLDIKKNHKRIDFTLDYLKQKKISSELIIMDKGDLYFQYLYLINLLDFVSFYLAGKKNVDPYNIDSIITLKSKLK